MRSLQGTTIRLIRGDAGSLDYSSHQLDFFLNGFRCLQSAWCKEVASNPLGRLALFHGTGSP